MAGIERGKVYLGDAGKNAELKLRVKGELRAKAHVLAEKSAEEHRQAQRDIYELRSKR